jgi:lipopolysaccharide transport system permease protein
MGIPRSVWRNKDLIRALVVRDISQKYKGSLLGLIWSLLNPLLLISVYTFVFGIVFGRTWSSSYSSTTDFVMILFAGLLVFNVFADCFGRAPTLITSRVNYVKRVIFPLEILPFVCLGAALFQLFVGALLWLVGYLVLYGLPNASALFAPLFLLPLCLFSLGLSWLFAALGVYLRDLRQIVGILITISLFISAVFYPLSAIPGPYRRIIELIPTAAAINGVRQAVFFNGVLSLDVFAVQLSIGAATAVCGFAWFQKTRKGFADVL